MTFSTVTKKAILLLLPILFVSCEKINDIRLQRIGSIPVSDAKYIFKREGGTKGGSNENLDGIWKITQDGEEVRLTVLNNKGRDTNIKIYSVTNITENFLHVHTESGQVLVDKRTNRVYKCPDMLLKDMRVEEYPQGTLYYFRDLFVDICKAQISSQSIKVETMLPEGQSANDFFIGQNEMIYYSEYGCYSGGGKLMTKNKRLYPIDRDDIVFGSADHNIYTIHRVHRYGPDGHDGPNIYEIYKWDNVSGNEIDKKLICTITPQYDIERFAPINTVSGNVVLFAGLEVYEFDGKSCILKRVFSQEEWSILGRELYSRLKDVWARPERKTIESNNLYFSENWRSNSGVAVSIDPITYELTHLHYMIPEDEYEMYNTRTDPSWGKLLFTALRYSDSSIVLGEVDRKGNVNIISERKSTYHISEYMALN